ncbi:hypothetical protein LWI29_037189 [Acer saccharum]|uniref:Transmembrane protein n=1 Tax=Acer saccharum TaxID=4024 RepID=A0AA39W8D9_ACESA|nr:hypothetical protein LWI29_037189 [Acer saccharum]
MSLLSPRTPHLHNEDYKIFNLCQSSQLYTEMAQVRICRALLAFVLFASVVATAVTAQDSELAPSPSMDAGAAFPVTFSGGFVCSSLLFSIIALIFLHQ